MCVCVCLEGGWGVRRVEMLHSYKRHTPHTWLQQLDLRSVTDLPTYLPTYLTLLLPTDLPTYLTPFAACTCLPANWLTDVCLLLFFSFILIVICYYILLLFIYLILLFYPLFPLGCTLFLVPFLIFRFAFDKVDCCAEYTYAQSNLLLLFVFLELNNFNK